MDRILGNKKRSVFIPALLGFLLITLIGYRLRQSNRFDSQLEPAVLAEVELQLHSYPPGQLLLPDVIRPISDLAKYTPADVSHSNHTPLNDPAVTHPRLVSTYNTYQKNFPFPSFAPVTKQGVQRLPALDIAPTLSLEDNSGKQLDINVQIVRLPLASDKEITSPIRSVLSNPSGSTESLESTELANSPSSKTINPLPGANAAMQAVSKRADRLVNHAISLAQRGATYSARAELIQALRVISQALDAAYGVRLHSQSLASGLQAIAEADDFVPKGSRLEADLQLPRIIAAHETPVLQQSAGTATPLSALQSYYTYAQQQLAQAGGHQTSASNALFTLGKIYSVLGSKISERQKLGGPKAMVMYQAALLVNSSNHQAANELGVLLAQFSRWKDARRVLLHSLSVHRQAVAWHNLAVVHQRLGEHDLAKRAQHEWQLTRPQTAPTSANNNRATIHWTDPATFATINPGPQGNPMAPMPKQAIAPAPAARLSSTWHWPWKKIN